MKAKKRIALVAHDERKADLLEWITRNAEILAGHDLYATGTTGGIVVEKCGLTVKRLKSGPLGGDQQLGLGILDEHGLAELARPAHQRIVLAQEILVQGEGVILGDVLG